MGFNPTDNVRLTPIRFKTFDMLRRVRYRSQKDEPHRKPKEHHAGEAVNSCLD